MEVEELKLRIVKRFKEKTGSTSITENKKIQSMFDSIIECIAPYIDEPKGNIITRLWRK